MVYKFGVVTISDSCFSGTSVDRSGPCLQKLIKANFTNATIVADILPDDKEQITNILKDLVEAEINIIITTGGTGFGVRDVTPEATAPLFTKACPQLSMAMFNRMFNKTKYAALSRGVCGISKNTLILNFPGSEKAVTECFDAISDLLPHVLNLLTNNSVSIANEHNVIQNNSHCTGASSDNETADIMDVTEATRSRRQNEITHGHSRNSKFPMLSVKEALVVITETIQRPDIDYISDAVSPINIPLARASKKDGYAIKSSSFSGVKKVIGMIAAGDDLNTCELQDDECFKINTGAVVPMHCDCIIQVEDTKLIKTKNDGSEDLVEILIDPILNLDIRPAGCDLKQNAKLFPLPDKSSVVIESVLASVGMDLPMPQLKIGILATGSELINDQTQLENVGQAFDSNSLMLEKLLQYFGFQWLQEGSASDDIDHTENTISELFESVDIIISTGGVSMGNRDCVKPALENLGFDIKFGRVFMKPGKPTVFAEKNSKIFFGLPGNPVSAFVTFHLFVLPALRWRSNWAPNKCSLAMVQVILQDQELALDIRPEYACATVTSKNGCLYAFVNGIQRSSRLQSIVGADVLLHLPGWSEEKPTVFKGEVFSASILRYDFISQYE